MERHRQLSGLAGAEWLWRWLVRRPSSLRAFGWAGRDEGAAIEHPWGQTEVDLPMGDGGYALVSRLSAGGMAELFLACRRGQAGIAHPVVVKRLRPDARRDPSIVRMFLSEAWISSRLRHPNVIRFHDFVVHGGHHHLVVEYVPGCDLAFMARSYFAGERAFPIEDAIEIGVGVLRALSHAHALCDETGAHVGLVHRDVSPQNVLLSLDGEVKLIDFGVAKLNQELPRDRPRPAEPGRSVCAERSTRSGSVRGKLGYVAPEQLRGEEVDARADIFAVGVLLFELLTGRRLFARQDDSATMMAVLSGEVPAIAPLRPACPALLEEVVRCALARQPEARFADAARMEEALADVLATLRAAPPSERRWAAGSADGGGATGQGLAARVRDVVGSHDRHRFLVMQCRPAGRGAEPSKYVGIPRSRSPRPVQGSTDAPPCRARRWPWFLMAAVIVAAGALAATAALSRFVADGESIRAPQRFAGKARDAG